LLSALGKTVSGELFQVENKDSSMRRKTETLEIGSRAPAFTLSAANRAGVFSLDDLLSRALLIVEFLRGTW
jgi:hypothetical protein